jgi:hypothetical protein
MSEHGTSTMSPDLERKLYLDGIRLFNEHEYFEAHEAWEDAWRRSTGLKRNFDHGLIQCAVALEHYRRSNPHGVRSLYKSYQPKFGEVPDVFMGLDVKAFLREMEGVLRPVVAADPGPRRGEIHLDLAKTPQIRLLHDPFAKPAATG